MDAAIAVLVDVLENADRWQWFVLPGVGWLTAVPSKGYTARAPRTGKTVDIAPSRTLDLEGERVRHRNAIRTPGCETIATTILARLRDREPAGIPGLGTFDIVEQPESTVRNPQTLENIVVPARSIVRFRAAESLKARFVYPPNYHDD